MLHRMGMWKGLDDAAGDVEAEGTDTAGSQPAVSVSCVANAQDELRCTSTLVVPGPTSAQLQGSWTRLLWLVQVILDISISEDGDPTSCRHPGVWLPSCSVCASKPPTRVSNITTCPHHPSSAPWSRIHPQGSVPGGYRVAALPSGAQP